MENVVLASRQPFTNQKKKRGGLHCPNRGQTIVNEFDVDEKWGERLLINIKKNFKNLKRKIKRYNYKEI